MPVYPNNTTEMKNYTIAELTAGAIITIAFLAVSLLSVYGIVSGLKWLGHAIQERDQAFMEAAEKYEECVRKEYGTTPTAWRIEHGTYPDCTVSE